MELVQYDKPVDRARAFMVEYAKQLFGINNASALAPLVEIAFDQAKPDNSRIQAARELLKYTEVPTRSIEYDGGKTGPDLEVTVLGTCAIEAPAIYDATLNSERLASATTSGSLVELSDGGREEGS